jgi:hypothetical protein
LPISKAEFESSSKFELVKKKSCLFTPSRLTKLLRLQFIATHRSRRAIVFQSLLFSYLIPRNWFPYSIFHKMELTLTLVLLILPVFYIGLSLLLHLTQDPQEPPVVDTILPFLSPMLGMVRKKTKYYVELRYFSLSHFKYTLSKILSY